MKKFNLIFTIICVLLFLFFVFTFRKLDGLNSSFDNDRFSFNQSVDIEKEVCYKNQTIVVEGSSMSPLIRDVEELIEQVGYYNCNQVQRGDVITYNYSGNENLLIKQIKAVENDTFEYRNKKIYINNQTLKNSVGDEYVIDSKMLKLYADSYPIIPKDTYLILGDNTKSSLDSSEFGLVDISDIVGRVVLE